MGRGNSKYRKGTKFEWELKRILEREGFAVVRSAGSHGVDLIAGRKGEIYAFECKSTSKESFYISKENILKLLIFSETFGARPYIAIKIKRDILFIDPYLLKLEGKNYLIDYYKIFPIALSFKELVGKK
ncbi:hypothetical protein CFE53_02520 [Methanofervidicoccus sp. A16]|uniref:Holliday junction resolvase Hjc n=1 Tax=Methanofervidicoccus sp. A16 TaxID=2607662 RepID=UPI00118B48DB|nr:Holliday junction resolvase Hjc [Methanofervidicoccus sp. A16]AXI25086.1 hypothetical protein CFE53_02520 [Methanofervidicoccus sp. A16]